MNTTSLNQFLQRGFEVRWKIGGKSSNDCTESKGRSGYDVVTNQTSCYCPDAPYVSDTCTMAPGVGLNAFYLLRIQCLMIMVERFSDCFRRLVVVSADNRILQGLLQ